MLMTASSSSRMGSSVLRTASDSPVRAMLLVESSYWRMRRASALTLSPSSSTMRSPGTRSAAATTVTSPSRTTLALAGTSFCSASVAFSARYSWKKPMTPLSSTTPMMATVTLMLSWRAEPVDSMAATNTSSAATSSMMANRLVNWSRKRKMMGRLTLAGSVLWPCCARRLKASSSVSPAGELPKTSKTCSSGRRHTSSRWCGVGPAPARCAASP